MHTDMLEPTSESLQIYITSTKAAESFNICVSTQILPGIPSEGPAPPQPALYFRIKSSSEASISADLDLIHF